MVLHCIQRPTLEKTSTAKELETYVEKKYNIQVDLVNSSYNFKEGNYGATFALNDNPKISFNAMKLKNGEIQDYYPEAVWVDEAQNDIYPLLKKHSLLFPWKHIIFLQYMV